MEGNKEQLNYTFILHQIRKKLKLSLIEYCIADSIYHLSNNPKSKVQGWCFASKRTIGEFLGTAPKTIFENLNKLFEKKLVEKDEKTKYLRTTQKWYENVVLIKMKGEHNEITHTITKGVNGLTRKVIHTITKGNTYNNSNNNKDNKADKSADTTFLKNRESVKQLFEKKKPSFKQGVFNWQWVVQDAVRNPYLLFIGLYWQQKDFEFENQTEARGELKRLMKKAVEYSKKYELQKFKEMLEWIEEDARKKGNYTWVFETLDKKISEFNNFNKPKII